MKGLFYFARITIPLAMLIFAGCTTKLIPSTNLKATKENKEIVAFLEEYKSALEKRTVGAILALVAKDFKDNLGSEDPAKEINYQGLQERLEKYIPRIQDIRLAMYVQHVSPRRSEKNTYEVVFYRNQNALIEMPSGETQWTSSKGVSRMIIRKKLIDPGNPRAGYSFEILSGI